MKTWERRERVMDEHGKWVAPGLSETYSIDGVELATEVSKRLGQGWTLLDSRADHFVLRSPPLRVLREFGGYIIASYRVEGFG